MVQIVVKADPQQTGVQEWSIIELQGDLEVENGESLANKFLGDLHFTTEGTAIMVLGHHTLHGKVQKLEKPYVMLKKNQKKLNTMVANKKKKSRTDGNEENDVAKEVNESFEDLAVSDNEQENKDNDGGEDEEGPQTRTEYVVQAVIRQKILFNKRPRPIVLYQHKATY